MQKCSVCLKKFRWNQIVKSIWTGYALIECLDCQTLYKITFRSRILFSVISIVPLYLLMVFLPRTIETYSQEWSFTARIIFYVIPFVLWMIITQTILPYFLRYKKIY